MLETWSIAFELPIGPLQNAYRCARTIAAPDLVRFFETQNKPSCPIEGKVVERLNTPSPRTHPKKHPHIDISNTRTTDHPQEDVHQWTSSTDIEALGARSNDSTQWRAAKATSLLTGRDCGDSPS